MKRIKHTICILLSAILICGILLSCQNTTAIKGKDSTIDRLNEFVAMVSDEKNKSFGYAGNQNVLLADFYKWYFNSGIETSIVNNAGDQFNNTDHL